MVERVSYAPSQHWDRYFRELQQAGRDLDWGNQWTGVFIKPLRQAGCQIILDLGCGTGNDTLRLNTAGFRVIGLDYSKEGIRQGLSKVGAQAAFVVADMAYALPFAPVWSGFEPTIEPLRSLRALKTLNFLDLNEREYYPRQQPYDLMSFQRSQLFSAYSAIQSCPQTETHHCINTFRFFWDPRRDTKGHEGKS